MPIEIRELHIKMNVNAGGEGSRGASGTGGEGNGNASVMADDDLIARCVELVMDVLRNRGER